MLEGHQLALQTVQRFDVRARGVAGEDAILDAPDLLRQRVEDGEVAVDDRVHQRVEHVGGAEPQQIRLLFAALADVHEPAPRIPSNRDDVAPADEYRHLAGVQFVVLDLDRVHDDEDRVAVLFDLGPLVAVAGVLDGELVQTEHFLHRFDLGGVGILQRDPDETVRPADVLADLADGDVGDLFPVLVGRAVDEHPLDIVLRKGRGRLRRERPPDGGNGRFAGGPPSAGGISQMRSA